MNTTRQSNRKLSKVLSRLENIPGWLTREEAKFLYGLSYETGGNTVELGAYQGRSTIALASGLKHSGRRDTARKMITIDTFRGSPEHQPGKEYFEASVFDAARGHIDTRPALERNLRDFNVSDVVEIWQSEIEDAAALFKGAMSLLFVDADHGFEAVMRHLRAWTPLLCPGGIVVLHDVGDWHGPTRAAADLLMRGFRRHDQVGTALALVMPAHTAELPSKEACDQKDA